MSDDCQPGAWHDAADDPRASYERHPVEDIEPLPSRDDAIAEAADSLRQLFIKLTAGLKGLPPTRVRDVVGRRAIALLLKTRPELMPGHPQQGISSLLAPRRGRRGPTSFYEKPEK